MSSPSPAGTRLTMHELHTRDACRAALERTLKGETGKVLVVAKLPDGKVLLLERDWSPDDDEA